jgi:GT2 family glycosyltransferase
MPQPEAEPANFAGIFAVIVLYGMSVSDSPTYRSLVAVLEQRSRVRMELLLFDNTPGQPIPDDLPAWVHYVASPMNTGLATAYNLAADMAGARGYSWLLTLDQDSVLPPSILFEFARLATAHEEDARIAAIVPHILAGERTVSPNWFVRDTLPRWFARGYSGVPEEAVYAFNSGALVRLDALRKIGGYSPLFWLDNCDLYLFRRFEEFGMRVFIAGNLEIQHDFSMLNLGSKMSLTRYRNALEAGSAFCDLELGWLAGVEHTGILARRYLRQVIEKAPREIRRLTARMIGIRLFQSRARRLSDWRRVQQARIKGYGNADARFFTDEIAAILDEVADKGLDESEV